MKRYLKLFARAFENSMSVMLVYRSNIVFFLIFETLFVVSQFLTVKIGFDLAGEGGIAGWSREQAYLLTAINGLSHQVFICFFINSIFSIGVWIWNGYLDYVLLKPLPALTSILMTGQIVVSNLPNLVLNLGLVVYCATLVEAEPPFAYVLCALLAFIGIAVRVALALICHAPAFFSEKLGDIEGGFWSLTALARYPMSIYPTALQRVFTFVVPLAMLASLPSSALFGHESATTLAFAASLSVAFVFFAAYLFLAALKRYQSVNSGM